MFLPQMCWFHRVGNIIVTTTTKFGWHYVLWVPTIILCRTVYMKRDVFNFTNDRYRSFGSVPASARRAAPPRPPWHTRVLFPNATRAYWTKPRMVNAVYFLYLHVLIKIGLRSILIVYMWGNDVSENLIWWRSGLDICVFKRAFVMYPS